MKQYLNGQMPQARQWEVDSPTPMTEETFKRLMDDLGEMEYRTIIGIAGARAMGRVFSEIGRDAVQQAVLLSFHKRVAGQMLTEEENRDLVGFLDALSYAYSCGLIESFQQIATNIRETVVKPLPAGRQSLKDGFWDTFFGGLLKG